MGAEVDDGSVAGENVSVEVSSTFGVTGADNFQTKCDDGSN